MSGQFVSAVPLSCIPSVPHCDDTAAVVASDPTPAVVITLAVILVVCVGFLLVVRLRSGRRK